MRRAPESRIDARLTSRPIVALLCLTALASCTPARGATLTDAQRAAIADTLQTMIRSAYDLSKPGDAVARLMSLYPASGPVVSASGGRVSTSRDTLAAGIRAFWE